MTVIDEGRLAMRGCWRLLARDPEAFDDFNLTIEGFWHSFAMLVPVLVMAYPLFISSHKFELELAAAGDSPAELRLGADYLYLVLGVMAWPVVAALLARALGVAQNYVRYMVIYNWMAVPMLALCVIPHLLHLSTGEVWLPLILAQGAWFLSLYASWYVAKAGLATTSLAALAFMIVDLAITIGLSMLIP